MRISDWISDVCSSDLPAVISSPQSVVIGEYAMISMLGIEEELAAEKKKMEAELQDGLAFLQNAGLSVRTHIEVGEPVPVITSLVDSLGIELVIVGHSRHKSIAARWWRGATDTSLEIARAHV